MAYAKLTPELEATILELTGQGKTTRQVADLVARRFGVKISHVGVGKALRRIQTDRADAAKETTRAHIGRTLTGDLDALEDEHRRLVKLAAREGRLIEASHPDGDVVRYCRLVDRLAKVTDLRLHYAGADTPDEKPETTASAARVMEKLRALAASNAPKA